MRTVDAFRVESGRPTHNWPRSKTAPATQSELAQLTEAVSLES